MYVYYFVILYISKFFLFLFRIAMILTILSDFKSVLKGVTPIVGQSWRRPLEDASSHYSYVMDNSFGFFSGDLDLTTGMVQYNIFI